MKITPTKLNTFCLFKLPAAWFCGVRVRAVDASSCVVRVRHRWINQNPFRSMFWAVQGMAAELSTGALLMGYIRESNLKISMLVTTNKATFTKKATGKITFICKEGAKIHKTIQKARDTQEGQTMWLQAIGTNEEGVVVSTFDFEWSIRVKA